MEKKPKKLSIESYNKIPLYYQKLIYKRKKFKSNSCSIHRTSPTSSNSSVHRIPSGNRTNQNKKKLSNIEFIRTKNENHKPYDKSNIYIKNKPKYYNLRPIILIQKWVRGFFVRKKLKKSKNDKKIIRTANPQRKINIFEAIKKNYPTLNS